MSSSAGLLEFFILEAGEYIERLDGLVAASEGTGPSPDDFTRQARALRGSATMVRLTSLAEVASGLERVGRGLGDGAVTWQPAVSGAVVAAIDDLKILVRAVRTWGAKEDALAKVRSAELDVLIPVRTAGAGASGGAGLSYLAGETEEAAAAVSALLASPAEASNLARLLARVRTLRGVASLRDVPPLAEVLEAVERATRPLEDGGRTISAGAAELLESAAVLLRRVSGELARSARPDLAGDDLTRFAAAAAALEEDAGDGEQVVPVADLFFSDAGPHIVETAANPPTTAADRFRLEVVSTAEHLRRLVADARRAEDRATRDRLGRELRASSRSLRNLAHSFGQHEVAAFVDSLGDGPSQLDVRAIGLLETAATLLAERRTDPAALARALGDLAKGVGTPQPAPAASAPVPTVEAPPPITTQSATPTGRDLHDMLATGIAGIERLDDSPLSEPVQIVDDTVVPIESLLYRGRAALDRALELRETIRSSLKDGGPAREEMDELLDLLELVATE